MCNPNNKGKNFMEFEREKAGGGLKNQDKARAVLMEAKKRGRQSSNQQCFDGIMTYELI
jgi:hypothetical protein